MPPWPCYPWSTPEPPAWGLSWRERQHRTDTAWWPASSLCGPGGTGPGAGLAGLEHTRDRGETGVCDGQEGATRAHRMSRKAPPLTSSHLRVNPSSVGLPFRVHSIPPFLASPHAAPTPPSAQAPSGTQRSVIKFAAEVPASESARLLLKQLHHSLPEYAGPAY